MLFSWCILYILYIYFVFYCLSLYFVLGIDNDIKLCMLSWITFFHKHLETHIEFILRVTAKYTTNVFWFILLYQQADLPILYFKTHTSCFRESAFAFNHNACNATIFI